MPLNQAGGGYELQAARPLFGQEQPPEPHVAPERLRDRRSAGEHILAHDILRIARNDRLGAATQFRMPAAAAIPGQRTPQTAGQHPVDVACARAQIVDIATIGRVIADQPDASVSGSNTLLATAATSLLGAPPRSAHRPIRSGRRHGSATPDWT